MTKSSCFLLLRGVPNSQTEFSNGILGRPRDDRLHRRFANSWPAPSAMGALRCYDLRTLELTAGDGRLAKKCKATSEPQLSGGLALHYCGRRSCLVLRIVSTCSPAGAWPQSTRSKAGCKLFSPVFSAFLPNACRGPRIHADMRELGVFFAIICVIRGRKKRA